MEGFPDSTYRISPVFYILRRKVRNCGTENNHVYDYEKRCGNQTVKNGAQKIVEKTDVQKHEKKLYAIKVMKKSEMVQKNMVSQVSTKFLRNFLGITKH